MVMTKILNEEEYNNAYQKYLTHMTENDASIVSSMGLSEESEVLTEGVIVDFLKKIVERIKAVWDKFVRKMNDFSTNNDKWLSKYEDTILNKPVKSATFKDYYQYDIDKIKNIQLPKLDDTMIERAKDAKSKDEFIQHVTGFSQYMRDTKLSFSDNLRNALRGQKHETYPSERADLKAMYGYCKGYNKEIKDAIYKSMDAIKTSEANAERISASIEKTSSTFDKNKVEKKEDNTTENKANNASSNTANTENKKEEKSSNESAIFTFDKTMEYYFNEALSIDDKKDEKKDNNGDTKNTDNNASTDENKYKVEVTKYYFTVAAEFLSSQLTIANEAYKTFIQILKWHVKGYDENADLGGEKKEENIEEKKEDNSDNKKEEKPTEEKKEETKNESASIYSESFLEAVYSRFGTEEEPEFNYHNDRGSLDEVFAEFEENIKETPAFDNRVSNERTHSIVEALLSGDNNSIHDIITARFNEE